MTERAIADNAYQVGQVYLVPTVRARWLGIERTWPVLGPLHEDAEAIGFTPYHWHIDPRFVCRTDFRYAAHSNTIGNAVEEFAVFPLMLHAARRDANGRPVRVTRDDHPNIVWRKRKCLRDFSASARIQTAPFQRPLQEKYADACVRNNACPHRGVDLSRQPVDSVGCVTCPAHGLRFDAVTGKLVTSAEWEQRRNIRGIIQ